MAERLAVAVRVRPFLPHESRACCVTVRASQIDVGESKSFAFDRVFGQSATSDDVYVALGQPLADSFLSGYHASTIAYGQTGAGKTFTMAALLNDTVQEIFCRLAEEEGSSSSNGVRTSSSTAAEAAAPSPMPAFTLSLTVLEVYNEVVGDLLSRHAEKPYAAPIGGGNGGGGQQQRRSSSAQDRKSGPSLRNGLQLREDPTGGVHVVGLTEVTVDSEARLLALIDEAIGHRKTAATLMNATSSRSHCVITLTLQRRGLCSRCCFVDLAGSERLKKSLKFASPTDPCGGTGNGGNNIYYSGVNDGGKGSPKETDFASDNTVARVREVININSGLLALGNVIVALCEKKPHVPYRSSKLTRLLQPLLEGHARTAMIACVAPLASSLEETLNTLKYADRAKHIHVDPHLTVASATTAANAQQLIVMLRDELEDAKRRLAATASQNEERARSSGSSGGNTTSGTSRSNSMEPVSAGVEQLRQLLEREQEHTKRLENDLFSAEYTAMVEVEKRKALEVRVAQLEAYITGSRGGSRRAHRASSEGRNAPRTTSPPSPCTWRMRNLERLQQLEEERNSLAVLQAEKVQDTQRLAAALAAEAVPTVADVDAAERDATPTAAAAAGENHLTAEIQHKESQIAALQEENGAVAAQLEQYERELQDTLGEKAKLQEELREAEVRLEKSAMEREQREIEKVALRAGYLERIRRAEVTATEDRRRVREAEQKVRARQEDIDRTRQLQMKVVRLREEVTRQRHEVRSTRKQSDQLSAAHQHEILQLQRQLQATTAQVAQLHQRMERKDAAIAKVRKQLTEEQPPRQVHQPTPHTPPPPHTTAPSIVLHKMPPYKQAASRRISLKPPPTSGASPLTLSLPGTPPSDTSPAGFTKRRLTLPPLLRSPSLQRNDAAQTKINRELQALERMEKELAELQEYREMLRSAQTTDAPKWRRAKEGFSRRLSTIQMEMQRIDAGTPAHANLTQEAQDVAEKLQQLEAYRHMFEDADVQLAEFENRIDNLNEARRFHLQRIRRLQQSTHAPTAARTPRRTALLRHRRRVGGHDPSHLLDEFVLVPVSRQRRSVAVTAAGGAEEQRGRDGLPGGAGAAGGSSEGGDGGLAGTAEDELRTLRQCY
ncbi:putative kinesin [Leptomonas pyrrhocoris]|uniref:Putative kinesin n=1 Tax=Leptomonas pyrrhocoris TaxID=157538 RepID=A0A0N0DTF4_LEPPY|nr:putative kinesin [Leptomonas pyrrhocoris]KPA77438.1 putative kinesin [Leptomonas pyrrhocoris]|eukprot:XP_015655877.1 putative kinesin [Leptomonas pyrrhocoris]